MRSSNLFCCLVLFVSLLIAYAGTSAAVRDTPTGDWEKIKDLNLNNKEKTTSPDKSQSFLTTTSFQKGHFVTEASSAATASDIIVGTEITGEWEEIKNLTDKTVIEAAEYATEIISNLTETPYKLVKVLRGELMHEPGYTLYHLSLRLLNVAASAEEDWNAKFPYPPQPDHKNMALYTSVFQRHVEDSAANLANDDTWVKITNLTDENVVAAAKWATEYINNKTGADPKYKFKEVLDGEFKDLPNGHKLYHLVLLLQVGDTTDTRKYEVFNLEWPRPDETMTLFKSSSYALASFNYHQVGTMSATAVRDTEEKWEKIKVLTHKHVVELAEFATKLFNEQTQSDYKLVKVLDGELMHYMSDGYTVYHLILLLKDISTGTEMELVTTVEEQDTPPHHKTLASFSHV